MQRPKPETVTLNDILITQELSRRAPRPANLQAENQAMRSLAGQIARDSQRVMQTLADTALELCRAGTAGISLLETTCNGEEIFRWTVLAGTLAHHVGGTTPRNYSPCGVCFEQGTPVLFSHPEYYFTYFQATNTPIVEGLVLPLIANSHILGTIWIMSHDEGRQFDLEDVRVMTSLADFTATALLLQQRQTGELLAANARLEAEIVERKQAEERTQALISNLPGGAVFVVDRDLRYLLAQGKALAAAGFKPEDFVGHTIFEALPPELATSYEPKYRKALAGEPFEDEHYAQVREASLQENRTYISRGTPLRAENGEVYAVLVVSYDISDRKRSEEALRLSEERFCLFVTASLDIFYRMSADWQEMRNLEGKRFLVNTDNPSQSWIETYIPSEEQPRVWAAIQDAICTKSIFELEHRVIQQDGTIGWTFSRAIPMLNEQGDIVEWFGTASNVTDRKQAEVALRESEARLALELADAKQLQFISSQLVQEENVDALYEQILSAAIALMRSEMGSIQMLHADRNELQLLAWKGFDPASAAFWKWVRVDSESTCGMALRTGERSIVPDVENSEFMAGSNDLDSYRLLGVRAVQSTPLVCRNGRVVGMISTHWQEVHQPSERELGLLDVLARQAADLIEQRQAEAALRESEAKYRSLFTTMEQGFCIIEKVETAPDAPSDFRYITVNPAFERHTGLSDVVGRTMRDFVPNAEHHIVDIYDAVVRTRQPQYFEEYVSELDLWFETEVFPAQLPGQVAILFSNVSDRKRAELALRESEERLQKAISIKTVGVLFFTLDGRITDANDTFLALSGYSREELRTIVVWQDLTPPEFGDATSIAALELATLGTTAPYEKQHLRKDGSRWWGLSAPTRLKGSGRNAECVEFVIDISKAKHVEDERKQAEAQLQRAAQMDAFRVKLSDALRSLSDPMQIQAQACRLLGKQLGVDRAYYVEVHEADGYARVNQHYSRGDSPAIVGNYRLSEYGWSLPIMRRGETIVITDTQSTDIIPDVERAAMATIRMIGFVALPLIKGEVLVGALAVNEPVPREWTKVEVELVRETAERIWADIQRAHAETALRDSEQRLSVIFAQAAVGLSEISLDGHFEQVNDALCQMLGRSRQELLAATVSEVTHSEDVPKTLDALAQLLETGESISFDKRYLCPDGTFFWANSILTRLNDEQGHPRHILAVTVDLSDRKQAEAERLQRIQEQAAHEEERQRAEGLAELDRAKTLFFSNVSHEFRTPLTLMLAPLQDALSDSTHPLDPVHRERLDLFHRNSLRLLKLVNTLLDFSRIEARRMEAVYESMDLATYTAELASVFRSAIEQAGLQLIVDCPPLPEPVFVDRQMWEKIVLNLLSNALKFTFSGEIIVSLHPNNSNQVMLRIRDTGRGIAPEHLPHLFERFYQVRGVQARTHEGSGIGLALVHELVQLQGGAIAVSSTVGEGTCFTITLPNGCEHLPPERIQATNTLTSSAYGAVPYVEEAQRWLPEESGRENEYPSPDLFRVLIVDDNADMRQYLTHILRGYVRVEAVADGTAALAAIQMQSPDLVLSDVMMPKLDGFGLLQTLRSQPRTCDIPVILLSARAGVEAIAQGLKAGADDYLIKPFSAQELISRVNAHLQIAHLRGEALHNARTTIQRKDEVLSVVSHELNTPLVSILGWTRLLRANPQNPAMLSTALEWIERSATMQAKLVQDLLDVSRIRAGKLRLNLQPTELEAVIEGAIATVTQFAAEARIHLSWTETTAAVVLGDRERLQQVVCNLLTNAIKFTPKGGRIEVCLSLVTGHRSFAENEQLMTNGNYAEIRVADTGIGIAADFLLYVFEQFRQAEGTNSAKGLGLGLAIARHIVELHNGTIQAQSAGEGQGATFVIRLPLLKSNH